MIPIKTDREQRVFKTYKKWLHTNKPIPPHILENFRKEVRIFERLNSINKK